VATSSREIRSAFAGRRRRGCGRALVAVVGALISVGIARAQSLEDLRNLSIDELANIEITSVSKRPEALSQAPSAVFVITADDIRRSGAASLPEALRLAPNLEVARINSQDYSISARGFNSANAADKLLVLIDGRTIYSPFFHNVNWNQNEVMLADVDRIEVISGPGGTAGAARSATTAATAPMRRGSDAARPGSGDPAPTPSMAGTAVKPASAPIGRDGPTA
jgi:iron complex outermembrane receptor protein